MHNDMLRQVLLGGVCATFLAFSLWALVGRRSLADALGYRVSAPNGESEFGAVYIGIFSAQALLCLFAIARIRDSAIGDMVAVFLLMQPIGRLPALIRHGAPTGLMKLLFLLEVVGGSMLLAIRPGG